MILLKFIVQEALLPSRYSVFMLFVQRIRQESLKSWRYASRSIVTYLWCRVPPTETAHYRINKTQTHNTFSIEPTAADTMYAPSQHIKQSHQMWGYNFSIPWSCFFLYFGSRPIFIFHSFHLTQYLQSVLLFEYNPSYSEVYSIPRLSAVVEIYSKNFFFSSSVQSKLSIARKSGWRSK